MLATYIQSTSTLKCHKIESSFTFHNRNSAVYSLHLFDDGALSGLASACNTTVRNISLTCSNKLQVYEDRPRRNDENKGSMPLITEITDY